MSEAVLALPLGTREIVRQSLDSLTRRDTGLRGASFAIGFMLLVTCGPIAVVLGLLLTVPELGYIAEIGIFDPTSMEAETWPAWLFLAAVPALLGYIAAGVDARTLATAVIGGRIEGRPLRLRESLAIARARFWHVLAAELVVGVLAGMSGIIGEVIVMLVLGPNGEGITFVVSLAISLLVALPFVYVPAGIVLGEVGVGDAILRSWRLVRLRTRLAVVVTLFGVFSQFIVLFGLSSGIDILARLVIGAGFAEAVPPVLVVPIAAALVFALGTLIFLVEAIAAAPAVHAFAALTHYTHGLELGRRQPIRGARLWDPWVTPGLAFGALLALLVLVGAVLALPV